MEAYNNLKNTSLSMVCKQIAESYSRASNRESFFIMFVNKDQYKFGGYLAESSSTYFEYQVYEKCYCVLISTNDERQTSVIRKIVKIIRHIGHAEQHGEAE